MEDSESAPATVEDAGAETAPQRRVDIQKVYVKDISYEAPGTPQIFTEEWVPLVSQDIANTMKQLSEFVYEVCLRVTITVKLGDKVAYLTEVNQAGIFNLTGYKPAEIENILAVFCPTLLFPYVRESISDVSARGGFPQLVLQHVDFPAMYSNFIKQRDAAQKEVDNGAETH